MRTEVMGVDFDNVDMDTAVEHAMRLMSERSGAYAVTPNPEIVMLCEENRELRAAVSAADLVLPDGVGVVYASRILGRPIKQKLPGIDFASELMRRCAAEGRSLFLYGAKPGVADKAAQKLTETYPGLEIVGCHDGYDSDEDAITARIREVSPELLFVCLGSPKQEIWMARHGAELGVGLMVGLGGSLDVFSGEVKRAPKAWQNLGLEWLYRLISEPSRAKRMVRLPMFLVKAVGIRLKGKS